MALVVEDGTGMAGSNGYISVEFFKSYHNDRGNVFGAATDDQISSYIIQATDYIDRRYSLLFGGKRLNQEQSLAWPRKFAHYVDGRRAYPGLPLALQQACAEYALRVITGPLAPDPTYDESNARVREVDQHVGPIVDHVVFGENGMKVTYRSYPLADGLIRQLLVGQGYLLRA